MHYCIYCDETVFSLTFLTVINLNIAKSTEQVPVTHTIILAYVLAHKLGCETLRYDCLTGMRIALWSISNN